MTRLPSRREKETGAAVIECSKPGVAVRWAALAAAARLLAVPLLAVPLLAVVPAVAQEAEKPVRGEAIYAEYCSQCHGEEGEGDGHASAVVFPPPRDLTSGMFKFRSTESGEAPSREDLARIVANGMPGTSMPPWQGVLSESEIGDVVAFVERFFVEEDDERPETLPVSDPAAATPQSVARGAELFRELECPACHGEQGRGDGQRSMTLQEDWGEGPIYPRNLTAGWLFRGGHGPKDIYRTVLFGLNGTPMPAHMEEEVLGQEAQRWALVNYVRSLGADSEPLVKSTLVAKWTDGELPLEDDHPLWEGAEDHYIPLAGQVMVEKRLFQPSVRYLAVRVLYNEREIGFRVRWVDATAEGSPALLEALDKAREESAEQIEPGAARPDGDANPADELVLQFAPKYEVGKALPYFLMGRPGRPVRLWIWRSDRKEMLVAKASRLGGERVDGGATALQSRISFRNGRYSLTLKRKRSTGRAGELQFGSDPGLVPISFSAVDGFKDEGGTRRAVATWYMLLLEKPVGARIFFIPIAVILLLAVVEWRLVIFARGGRRRKAAPKGRAH